MPAWDQNESGKIDLLSASIEKDTQMIDIGLVNQSYYITGATIWYGQISTVLFIEWESNKTRWLILEDDTQTWQATGKIQITNFRPSARYEPMIFDYEGVGKLYFERSQLELPV